MQNFGGLCALRLLLGAAEAMYAGAPFYLSFFYARDKIGLRQGIFLSGSALANAYGGALGYAILLIKGNIAPWRALFLIEGLPTLIMVAVAYFFLPDSLAAAKFLNEREREVAIYCVRRSQIVDTDHHEGIRWKELMAGLKDWRSKSFCFLPLENPDLASIGFLTKRNYYLLSPLPFLVTSITTNTHTHISKYTKQCGNLFAY